MAELRNLISQAELKKRLQNETEPRTTLSFYAYHPIDEPQAFRDELYRGFSDLDILGRIYVAGEGINAQLSVPRSRFEALRNFLDSISFLRGVRLNIAVEDDGHSFWVLSVKVRPKIVADGIEDPTFSMQRRGKYLDAAQFNAMADDSDTVIVDMRNYYEYEVGHFENALEISVETFREQLPEAIKTLEPVRDKNIVMYCTGGIRCEKASAYLLHHGFCKVYHLEGGILEYARQVKQQDLENKFQGKNFVFDDRLGEQIGGEIISRCHQCDALSDSHRNCANDACHLLFIQCAACGEKFEGCCSAHCRDNKHLAPDAQKAQVETQNPPTSDDKFKPRTRSFDVRNR